MGMYNDPYYIDKKIAYRKKTAKHIASRVASVVSDPRPEKAAPVEEPEETVSPAQDYPAASVQPTEDLYSEIERVEAEMAGMSVPQYRVYRKFLDENERARQGSIQPPEEPQPDPRPPRKAEIKELILPAVRVFVIVGIVAFMVWVYSQDLPGSSHSSSSGSSSTPPKAETIDPDAALTPKTVLNGQIICHPNGERVAPLKISTSGDMSYYIVLSPVDFEAKVNGAMSFYVSSSKKSVETEVPLGEYKIYYACGETWYGTEHKFGANTICYQCDDTFWFTSDEDGYNGWDLTLYKVSGGNMSTDEIPESDFPNI